MYSPKPHSNLYKKKCFKNKDGETKGVWETMYFKIPVI